METKQAGLPNLGCIGTVIVALVTAHISARLWCVFVILRVYGPSAYHDDGLRVTDWKHGILSNGEELTIGAHLLLGLGTFFLWVILIGVAELVAYSFRRRPWPRTRPFGSSPSSLHTEMLYAKR